MGVFMYIICSNKNKISIHGIAIGYSCYRKKKMFTHSLPKPFLPPTPDSDDPDSNKIM